MRFLDRLQAQTLAILALLAVFVAATVASPYLPYATLHAQQVGPGGVPGAGEGGGAVASVFGRTGAVVAANGDYTAAQVTNAAATNAANTFSAAQTIGLGNSLEFSDPGATPVLGVSIPANVAQADFSNLVSGSDLMALNGAAGGFFAPGIALNSSSCVSFTGDPYNAKGTPTATICQPSATGVVTFGTTYIPGDTTAWLQFSAMGNGTSGNTDMRGHLAAATSAFSYTFTKTYTVAPTCVLNDTTAHNVPTFTVSVTTLSGTTTGATDNVNWVCAD